MTQTKQGVRSTTVKPPMVEVRAHAPEQQMLKQTKYTSTIQQSVNYKLMIVGASQSNQEVGKTTL